MKLLLANDDGIFAPGIIALAKELSKEHKVVISAPKTEQSGMAHSLTYRMPLKSRRVMLPEIPDVEAYYVEGTPADCVKFGLGNLCPDADMVVTGINNGANISYDLFYSGTVAAAREAVLCGVPAVAMSIHTFDALHNETAARYAAWAVEFAKKERLPLINVNVPDLPYDEVKGVKITPMGKTAYDLTYKECTDPRGIKYYWLSATPPYNYTDADDYDAKWLLEGYVAVTPLVADFTDYSVLERLTKK